MERVSYPGTVQVTYDIVLLDKDNTILDYLDGEFGIIASAKKRIKIFQLENPEYLEDGAYLGIREIKREIISKTYQEFVMQYIGIIAVTCFAFLPMIIVVTLARK